MLNDSPKRVSLLSSILKAKYKLDNRTERPEGQPRHPIGSDKHPAGTFHQMLNLHLAPGTPPPPSRLWLTACSLTFYYIVYLTNTRSHFNPCRPDSSTAGGVSDVTGRCLFNENSLEEVMKSSLTPLTSRLISSGDTRQQNAESGLRGVTNPEDRLRIPRTRLISTLWD